MFLQLLRQDEKLKDLWEGNGKAKGDTSGLGYDFSIARRLLALGYRDVDQIGTVLALRPNGSFQNGNKKEEYLCRTIGKALSS